MIGSERMQRKMTRAGIPLAAVTTNAEVSTIRLPDGGRLSWCQLVPQPGEDARWSWGRYDAQGWMTADSWAEDCTGLIEDLAAQLREVPAA